MPLPSPDPDVIHAAARGDATSWSLLTDEWLPVVLRWSRRLAGPDVDAEDIAHDVWLKLYRRLGQLRAPEAFGSWAYQVTRDTVRKKRERHQRWANVRALLPRRPSAPAPNTDPHCGEAVLRILQQLPEEQREALVLCLVEERTREEAAALAGVPLGTIKSRLRTGTQRFRVLARQARLIDADEVAAWRN